MSHQEGTLKWARRILRLRLRACVSVSRMRLSRLRERDMDAFPGRLVHLGLQTPVKLFY